LLKQQGFDISAVTLKLYDSHSKTSVSLQAISDAKKVCDFLNIKHYVLDLQKEFHDTIINNFISSYLCATTPNPCILCNEKIKFGLLLDYAKKLGFDYLATGHYAKIENINDEYKLKIGKDISKDQTYFLYRLTQKELAHLLFPLADYTKDEIRDIANSANLPVANKPDSQEICFIEKTYHDFLKQNIKDFKKRVLPGLIVDTNGKTLGKHKGLIFYTIGQRSGLGITTPEPVYVLKMDRATNSLVVGTKNDIYSRIARIKDITFISNNINSKNFTATVKIRRMHQPAKAFISNDIILFDEQQASITPGQSAVFYDNNYVVGGGIII
jgi:tRNA-specific 2-thiouridylase